MALQLAQEKGAELIVAVGTHFNLVEFLERNRAGMSSTFVTRLKVGEILVDAKGVSRLVEPAGRRVAVRRLRRRGDRRQRRRGRGVADASQRDRRARRSHPGGARAVGAAARPLVAVRHNLPPCLTQRRNASCSRRPATSGSSCPSRTTFPTGGRASPPSSRTAAAPAPDARWKVQRSQPGWFHRGDDDETLLVTAAEARRQARVRAGRLAGPRRSPARGRPPRTGRTPRSTSTVPWLTGSPRKLAGTALSRLHALCQTARLNRRCSTSATTSRRSRPSSSR